MSTSDLMMPPSSSLTPAVDLDEALVAHAAVLRDRATSLRRQAAQLEGVLADTYRRRASELELETWIAEVQSGLPVEQVAAPE
jgi:hypothetical protein